MDPITREEQLMAGEQLEPITRKEYFLAKAAGMDVETPEPITREEMFLSMISGGGTGGSGGGGSIPSVSPKAVNFYDYDGTCLYAYTVEEAQALTKMPPLPEREGLICQGWNWSLEDVKAHNRAVNVGATYTTDDGTTRIYITLIEGLTSPDLSVGLNGTAVIDWGDNSETQTISGTATHLSSYIRHDYSKPGDYVIRLKVEGTIRFMGSSSYGGILITSSESQSLAGQYHNTLRKLEIGSDVDMLSSYSFQGMNNLEIITIPNGLISIDSSTFAYCYSLKSLIIPNSVTSIGSPSFSALYSLKSLIIPNSVTSMKGTVSNCYSLETFTIPNSVTSIGGSAFYNNYNIRLYDFTHHTSVPTLENTNAFSGIMPDCEIRVPAALYDEWIAATNWATYASYIKAV